MATKEDISVTSDTRWIAKLGALDETKEGKITLLSDTEITEVGTFNAGKCDISLTATMDSIGTTGIGRIDKADGKVTLLAETDINTVGAISALNATDATVSVTATTGEITAVSSIDTDTGDITIKADGAITAGALTVATKGDISVTSDTCRGYKTGGPGGRKEGRVRSFAVTNKTEGWSDDGGEGWSS